MANHPTGTPPPLLCHHIGRSGDILLRPARSASRERYEKCATGVRITSAGTVLGPTFGIRPHKAHSQDWERRLEVDSGLVLVVKAIPGSQPVGPRNGRHDSCRRVYSKGSYYGKGRHREYRGNSVAEEKR